MSIAPTRRVSISSPVTHVEKNYATKRDEEFVEVIDTNNNVSVRADTNSDTPGNRNFPQKNQSEEKLPTEPQQPYVNNTIEALAASGIYENDAMETTPNRVTVYSNNQSIIKDEELDRTGHSYLKHFYEKNEPVIEVDEFI